MVGEPDESQVLAEVYADEGRRLRVKMAKFIDLRGQKRSGQDRWKLPPNMRGRVLQSGVDFYNASGASVSEITMFARVSG